MTEDLVRSTSSQRSNPRVLRRVRPVPYECCGGAFSFLNSGCFTLCCKGGSSVRRRRSSVYAPTRAVQKDDDLQNEFLERQISENTKRLIKPNSQDGLTAEDLYAFERELDSDEYLKKQNYDETSFELDGEIPPRSRSEEILNDDTAEKDDEISILTDDTSVSVGEGSAKKKKKKRKISNILKLKKKKSKSKDGVSVASSVNSVACSELSAAQSQADVQVEGIILEKNETEKDNVPDAPQKLKEKGTFISRSLQSVFASMRLKKGKKNSTLLPTNDDSNQAEKVIPLGLGIPSKPVDLEVNLQKKPFWKTFSKKEKKKKDNPEIVDGIKPPVVQTEEKKFEVGTDAFKVFGTDIPAVEAQNVEVKKKTLLATLKPKKDHTSAQIPCLLTSCVNSDIKPEGQRKDSSDSIEVKTIAEDDPENDGVTIKIVRNEFFPAEVRSSTDPTTASNEEGIDEVDVELEEIDTKELADDEETKGEENTQDSPLSAKKYEVFEKEDFSESLHTLIDEEGIGDVLLAPKNALTEVEDGLKEKTEELAEGIFRTSCRLSIEGSQLLQESENDFEEMKREGENKIKSFMINAEKTGEEVSENVVSSCETLTEANVNIEKSTDTEQKEDEESRTTSWIEVANLEDLSESQFNYIYKTTLEGVRSGTDHLIDDIRSAEKIKNSSAPKEDETEAYDGEGERNVANLRESEKNDQGNTKVDEESHSNLIEESEDKITSKGAEITSEIAKEVEGINKSSGLKTLEGILIQKDYEIKTTATEKLEDVTNSKQLENSCEICGKSVLEVVENVEKAKCVCTTMTKPRQSLTEIEEGSVKSKVDAFNKSKHPIIVPLSAVEFVKKDDVMISEAHSSPTLGAKSKSATPSPIAAKSRSGTLSSTNSDWQNQEEDLDRMIQGRGSLSGLGLRSDSMASVYSGAGEGRYGTVAVRGQVEFGLQYNYKAGCLEIHVKQCKDLAPVDIKRNRSDPYVKVYLLPDKSKSGKRKTKVKKHTLNPVFDETLKFQISLNGLETRTLWLTVWHSDMFGRNDFLGEVMMALENKVFDDPAPVWYNLQERTEPFDDTISFKGDIIVCLKFVPPDMTVQKKGKRSRGTLHVLVKEAKYLTAYKANGTSDPFCKSYLLPDKGRNSKQKTPVVKKTVNPVWNHTFIYEDVTLQELAERCLELTVWDHDRLASNEFLGGVRFSLGKHYGKPVEWMDATGKELTLWKSMLERPNFWVEGCLSLRPSLEARAS